ncbi:hypothetical protein CASFOL_035258 [Castilleja foliolosa]|uniref:Uncharacterized protein n=1 Tax=Castilleja foliolosa TaxID=1961234 RepID=A0ABD3BS50_9LAMI
MANKLTFLLYLLFVVTILAPKQASSAKNGNLQYGISEGSLQPQGNVHQDAHIGAQRQHSRSHACSTAKNVVQCVCVCHLAHMGTSKFALATTTGKPREVDQNALEKKTYDDPVRLPIFAISSINSLGTFSC